MNKKDTLIGILEELENICQPQEELVLDKLAECKAIIEADKGHAVLSNSTDLLCTWDKAFDGHFNLGCAGETGERGNGRFIGKARPTNWHFTYCPYCGRKIKLV